jgi:hypothetical protein
MDAPLAGPETTTKDGARRASLVRRGARSPARWLAIVALMLPSGCDTVRPQAEPAPTAPPSPQTQLDHVNQRLKDALAHARPASDASVVSERQCAVRLIEPTAEGEPYMAEVVIQTSLGLKTGKGKGKKIQPIGDVVGSAAGDVKDSAKATDAEEDDPSFEKRFFKLVYKNQRWELAEPPLKELTDTERICFQSALSDG